MPIGEHERLAGGDLEPLFGGGVSAVIVVSGGVVSAGGRGSAGALSAYSDAVQPLR